MALRDRLRRLEARRLPPEPAEYRADQPESEEEAREWMEQLLERYIPGATLEQQREFLTAVTRSSPGDAPPLPEGYEYPPEYKEHPRDHRADA